MDSFKFKTSFANDIIKFKCSKCKEIKLSSEFSRTGIVSKNPKARRDWQAYCKSCLHIYCKQHAKDNKEWYKIRNSKSAMKPARRLKQLVTGSSTVDRSALNYEELLQRLIQQKYCCAITGIPFEYSARNPRGISIDKIDPNKPYTMDNVRLVCWWVNAAMSHWGLDTLKSLIKEWQEGGYFE